MPSIAEWQLDLGYITLTGLCRRGGDNIVIALHGYLDNANSMIGLAPAFADATFIALDLPGHGKSGHRPAGVHYNQLDYVQDLHQVIQILEAKSVTLVGHSLGGIIASLYAAVFATQVSAVISIDALGPLTRPAATTQQQIHDAIVTRSKKMSVPQAKSANLNSAARLRAHKTDLNEHWSKYILQRNIIEDDDGNQFWRSDSRLRTQSLLRFTEQQAEDLLTKIQCPMLVIAASNSFKNLPSSYTKRKPWIKHMTLKVLQGGHHIHLEKTDETNAIISEFVSKM